MEQDPAPTTESPPNRGLGLLTVTALILVAVTSGSAFSLLAARSDFVDDVDQLQGDLVARCASEAGIAAAVFDFRSGGDGNLGKANRPITFGTGSYWVHTRKLSSGLVSMVSIGVDGDERRRTELIARPMGEGSLEIETVSIRSWFDFENEE